MDTINQISSLTLSRLTEEFGLPLHIIFKDRIKRNVETFQFVAKNVYPRTQICFAVKSNPCRGAVRTASQLGLGIDAVSEYELQAALAEGIPASKIVCNGNAKTDEYLRLAVDSRTLVAVDSEVELQALNYWAELASRRQPILLRLAGLPLEGLTAADQSTAAYWTKFGFPWESWEAAVKMVEQHPWVELQGLSAHIGTQICAEQGYHRLAEYLVKAAEVIVKEGFELKYVDIGGGFPVNYISESNWSAFQNRLRRQLAEKSPPEEWITWDRLPMGFAWRHDQLPAAADPWVGKAYWSKYPGAKMFEYMLNCILPSGGVFRERLREFGEPTLIIEPGRALIGTAGITAAGIMGVKEVKGNWVVLLDLGIVNHGTNLVTPDIYPFEIWPPRDDDREVEAFVAGRLCFTGDMISKVKVTLNRLPKRGDLMLIHHTGAYAADHFASHSCGYPLPTKVAVADDGEVEVWRRKEVFEDVFKESWKVGKLES